MYKIYADGELLYHSGAESAAYAALSPRLSVQLSGSGSLSFVLPPGNRMHGRLSRLKTIVTVYEDDEQIFRGRVMDETRDFYNQITVYCEGDKSFLLDSQYPPYAYSGGVQAFFRALIDNHNAQVDADRQFAVGEITAVDAALTMEAEDTAWQDTSGLIDSRLVGAYGGYLRTRTDGGVHYIDWLSKDADASGQPVEFAVNLLDLSNKLDASQVFTVLIPVGASSIDEDGNYTEPVGIASVNDGLNYIEDEDAVALYGKVWRVKTWPHIDDPALLLQKAWEHMKTGVCVQTLTLKLIDMHFTGSGARRIWVGDHPHILTAPHGLDLSPICASIDLDLENPESSEYVFGEPPETLTENVVEAEEDISSVTGYGGGGKTLEEELKEIYRWAEVQISEEKAQILLTAGDVNNLTGRMSSAEILIDGLAADILLKADRQLVNDLETRITSAEVDIDGMNASILLKADANIVDSLGQRVSSAEVEIDGLNSEITLKADKIDLDGYVTADEFSSLESDIASLTSGTVQASHLYTQNLTATNTVRLSGHTCVWKSLEVVTGASLSKSYVTIPGGNGADYVAIGGVSLSKDTETIYYLGY